MDHGQPPTSPIKHVSQSSRSPALKQSSSYQAPGINLLSKSQIQIWVKEKPLPAPPPQQEESGIDRHKPIARVKAHTLGATSRQEPKPNDSLANRVAAHDGHTRTNSHDNVSSCISSAEGKRCKERIKGPGLPPSLANKKSTLANKELPRHHAGVTSGVRRTGSSIANSSAPSTSSAPGPEYHVRCSTCRHKCFPSTMPLAEYNPCDLTKDLRPGIRLPCPLGHVYCIRCLRSFIDTVQNRVALGKSISAPGCYQCAIRGYPDWRMPMDILGRMFLPYESFRWGKKDSLKGIQNDLAFSGAPSSAQNRLVSDQDLRCGICMDPFKPMECPNGEPWPKSDSVDHADLRPGLILPCPGRHRYCMVCISTYIEVELKKGSDGKTVFPMRCPECPPRTWSIPELVAERVLTAEVLEAWHFQKLLDSIVKIYCPYPDCSALVEVPHSEDLHEATCPACQRVVCAKCRVPWHNGFSCEDYYRRNNADRLTYELARRAGWRRCPRCKMIVERSSGCAHMSCRCGHHFCYRCGSDYMGGTCQRGSECRENPDPSLTPHLTRRHPGHSGIPQNISVTPVATAAPFRHQGQHIRALSVDARPRPLTPVRPPQIPSSSGGRHRRPLIDKALPHVPNMRRPLRKLDR
ncbi:hypothetical protein FRC03_001815 [Tulasnella sp. 419]|nr:hypothetical protein FRC03_001815 [Tulasnella sp. 419]